MKKVKFLIACLLTVMGTVALAQKTEVVSAFSYLKYDQLDKAKESIDKAVTHETTMNYEKAWYYRGLIYQSLYKNEKFGSLTNNALDEALKSFDKCLEINPKYENADDIKEKKVLLAKQFADKGFDDFTKKDYTSALSAFESVLKLNPSDTAVFYNAAISADRAKMTEKAKQYYAKLTEMNYNDSKFYQPYVQILLNEKDTTKALEVLNTGLTRFPEDKNMLISQTNIYIQSGKTNEALTTIEQAITKDASNPSLYFAKGNLYEKSGKEADAVAAYKKAIEIKSDYFDAYYNLGALYFNQAAKMANDANKIQDNAKYAKAKADYEAKFNLSKPYFEKALEVNPKDQSTLVSLKQLYASINDTVNYDRIKAKLDNLNK